MQLSQPQVRYSLIIRKYPSEKIVTDVCRLIYQSTDSKLVGSLSGIPYTVGRSFSQLEAATLAEEFKKLRVSFHFKSSAPEAFDIEFDPELALKEGEQIAAQPFKGESRLPWKLIVGIFGVAALVSTLAVFGWKYRPSLETQQQEASDHRALIENLERDVEYRRGRDLVWNRASQDTKLFDSDAVRTFENSSALLRYREGSTVNVRPSTLMVIGTNANAHERSIELQDGTLQARLKPSQQPTKLSIHTQAGTLEMESPKPGEEESRVETSVANGEVRVAVTQGRARLQPKEASQVPIEIGSFQQIQATADKVSMPTRYEPVLNLLTPGYDEILKVDPQGVKALRFEWENLGPGTQYRWTVATDPQMKNILVSQETNAPEASVNFLDLGTLYWRVVGSRDGVEFKSAASRIHVQKHQD